MNTNVMFQIERIIRCGGLACVRNCCQGPSQQEVLAQLRELHVVMNLVGDSDLDILYNMLCGCAQPQRQAPPSASGTQKPPPATADMTCQQKIQEWVSANAGTIDGVQALLGLAAATGEPGITQAAAAAGQVLEQIEDLAQNGVTNGWRRQTLDELCRHFLWLADWYDKLVQKVPAPLQGFVRGLSEFSPVFVAARKCCANPSSGAESGSTPQLPAATPAAYPTPGDTVFTSMPGDGGTVTNGCGAALQTSDVIRK